MENSTHEEAKSGAPSKNFSESDTHREPQNMQGLKSKGLLQTMYKHLVPGVSSFDPCRYPCESHQLQDTFKSMLNSLNTSYTSGARSLGSRLAYALWWFWMVLDGPGPFDFESKLIWGVYVAVCRWFNIPGINHWLSVIPAAELLQKSSCASIWMVTLEWLEHSQTCLTTAMQSEKCWNMSYPFNSMIAKDMATWLQNCIVSCSSYSLHTQII